MDAEHRQIIKENSFHLQRNIDYRKLIQYLQEYRMFNKYMWKDMHSVSDLLALLPTRGPKAFRSFIKILREADYNTEADLLEKPASTFENSDKHFYKMSTKPLGYCLIINNMKFTTPKPKDGQGDILEYRYGSDVDEKSLLAFFEKAGFEVKVETNLTADEMNNCLINFSGKEFNKVDSMILIIMSHGGHLNNKELLYGTDGDYLFKEYIYNIFNNKQCIKLQSKPKVFFFIACRGTAKDYGVPKSQPKESFDAIGNPKILPALSDVLVINSTLPYNVTIRDHEKGTYFCQALVSILNECYEHNDLETMMKFVSEKLEGTVSEVFRIVQATHSENFLWKKKMMLCRRN